MDIKKLRGLRGGFTLYELMITLAIVTIIAGIVLFNQSKFKSDVEITNVAYRMALAVRQAQVYSISVKGFGSGINFDVPYGIHFNNEAGDSIILFADADGNGIYSFPGFEAGSPDEISEGVWEDMECVGQGSECVEKITLGRGNEILGWCGILLSDSNPQNCYLKGGPGSGENVGYQFMDTFFKRPNPDAIFRIFESDRYVAGLAEPGGACVTGSGGRVPCTGWAICARSPDGKIKKVVLYETGQISVENPADSHDICASI